ncbi:ABC transporter permease [Candidatus Woesearchaeota archaeon]|nr:ABC transporter permease [Candidatus Woesearchaeota archaeon]
MGRFGNLNVLKELVITDFRLKYRSPIFGYMWSILNPLMLLVTLYIVFSLIMDLEIPNYQLFLLIGIIIWNFFNDATELSLNSLQEKGDLIKKLNLSPLVYLVSAILTSLLNLLINIILFVIMMLIFRLKISIFSLLFGLAYICLLIMCTFGISMIITAIYLDFKDIKHIWTIITPIWFWLTPIFYSEQLISEPLRKFYMLNPVARIINHSRDVFMYNYTPSLEQTLITFTICLIFVLLGAGIYRRKHNKFAEDL